jgi:hypothetical protein
VILIEDDDEVEAALPRAATVRAEKWSSGSAIGTLLRRSLRFVRSEEEMERFLVLISKRSRFLSVIPESMAIRMHTRLAKVKPNGKPTQTNLPKPMIAGGSINDWRRTSVLTIW